MQASLLVDYILTVAVSISSGADAFVAAFPSLYDHKVLIACLLVLFILVFAVCQEVLKNFKINFHGYKERL